MSQNLIQLLKRRAGGTETALDVLRDAMDQRGSLTDEDRRRAAALSGLPEAAVYGVSTFYDDLVQLRGRRNVRVCTGTACWAVAFDGQVGELERAMGLSLGECTEDGELSLNETVCLGFCHSSPSFREGDVIDAGPGAAERVLAGGTQPAEEPEWRSVLQEPVLIRPGDFSGLHRALAELTPEQVLDEVKDANLRGRGGAGFPAGLKWEFARKAPGSPKFIVVNGDEGDPGSYIDKYLMEQNPALLLEGMAIAGYAVGAYEGLVYVRSEYPRSKPALDDALARAYEQGHLGDDISGSGFSFHVHVAEGAGSYVVGEETALLNSLMGLRGTVNARPPFPAERGYNSLPTVVNNVETLCNAPFIALEGAEAYAALSPGATPGTKLVCLNERFERPGVYEVRFGTPLREICDDLGGGLRDGHTIKALQIGGPLGGILPGWELDTAFDFDQLAERGCMVGHGGIVAFDDRTDMRALARHLLRFGAHESCGKCFPCRIGLTRALELVEADAPVERAKLEELLETLEVASLCAHGGGMPAPIRSLIAHFPDELGHRLMEIVVDGVSVEVEPGATLLAAARLAERWVPTLCFDDRLLPFGACRVCLVGIEGSTAPVPACTTLCREGMSVSTADERARRIAANVVELVLSELPRAPAPHTELAEVARRLGIGDLRWTGATHAPRHDERHPYLTFQHELCISCGRCIRACDEVQGAFALTATGRGFHANVTAGLDSGFLESSCVSCGACADTCPTDAIAERLLVAMAEETAEET